MARLLYHFLHNPAMARCTVFITLTLLAMGVKEIEPSSESMKSITSGFMKVLEACREELNFSDHVVRDLYFYWKEDYTLINRETGCAIVCMSKKLNLLDSSGQLHHGNAKDFAMTHGAAEDTAGKLVTALHECEKQFLSIEDACNRALEVAKCFRTAIDQLNWVPSMDVVLTEVMTDM